MSWSFSYGGRRDTVREDIKAAHVPDGQHQGELAREAIKELLASIPEESNVSVSCYGHQGERQGNAHITVAYSPANPHQAT